MTGSDIHLKIKRKYLHNRYCYSRESRQSATEAEILLWSHLRNRQLAGWKFRRQHPCQPYILDFYCPRAKLCIELDGSVHLDSGQKDYDRDRSIHLNKQGITIIRFWNNDVIKNLDKTLETILNKLKSLEIHTKK